MKTAVSLLLAFCLSLARSCAPTPRPVPAYSVTPAPVAGDTAGLGYRENQQRLCAEWQWYGGN